ncbi:transposase [Marinomonas foliarum]|uniref:Transposase n=1 Tax=Marinomonas foliarum TaxID=491950 RepID=A0ABX7ILH3_9GAMM|nr:transposase [Marinomonas foliarum]QRV22478.1 transposase [Marinomonas foliarum]
MARLPRLCPIGIPQHIIQRGNNRQVCSASEDDFIAYVHWLTEYAQEFDVKVHAWVLMTNHVHLLATPMTEGGISKMMQALGRRYVRYFNYTYQRTGTLWEGRFKSCVINAEEYFFICQRYIELNPVRANMVGHPADYKWSSYRFHAQESLDLQSELWQPHELYLKLSFQQETRAKRYQALFKYHIPEEELGRIRSATHSDMALGNDRFKEEIEKLTGRRVTPRKRGRKPSQMD